MNDAPPLPDRIVVQCNYRVGTSVCAAGARAYLSLVTGQAERVCILARSRSGRWVLRWESLKRLHNFRFKTLCAADPLYSRLEIGVGWNHQIVEDLNHLATEAARKP
jgi:hypothetical protein